jgi:hypothetical protein
MACASGEIAAVLENVDFIEVATVVAAGTFCFVTTFSCDRVNHEQIRIF